MMAMTGAYSICAVFRLNIGSITYLTKLKMQ